MTTKEILSNLHQEDPDTNVFEYILEDGEELTLRELKELNHLGYAYHSEQTDIDYEDQLDDDTLVTKYMNIYYFSKANINIHEHQIPA
jgi:hypothetical protein